MPRQSGQPFHLQEPATPERLYPQRVEAGSRAGCFFKERSLNPRPESPQPLTPISQTLNPDEFQATPRSLSCETREEADEALRGETCRDLGFRVFLVVSMNKGTLIWIAIYSNPPKNVSLIVGNHLFKQHAWMHHTKPEGDKPLGFRI